MSANSDKECRMEMVEDAEFKITWECSSCGASHKDSKNFEKKKSCAACGASISEFIGLYDDDED